MLEKSIKSVEGRKQYTSKYFSEIKRESPDDEKFKELKSTNAKLNRNVRESVDYYLKKIPEYSVLNHQINELELALEKYVKANNKELIEKTQNMIYNLNKLRKIIEKVVKGKDITDNDKELVGTGEKTKYQKSDEYIKLEETRRIILDNMKKYSANAIMKKIADIELAIKDTKELMLGISKDVFNFDDFETDSLDEKQQVIENLKNDLNVVYGEIADLTGLKLKDLISDKYSKLQIRNALNEVLKEKYNAEKERLEVINLEMSQEREKSSNEVVKLSELVFSVLGTEQPDTDLENPDSPKGKQAREILALSHISLVQKIAYFNCQKYGANHLYDEAVSAGLLGLSTAINIWYQKQKLVSQPISFKSFAQSYISNTIKTELQSIFGMGAISGTNYADKIHYEKRRIETFLNANKEIFTDVNKEYIDQIVSSIKDGDLEMLKRGTTETELTNHISGGESGDENDIWSNVLVDDDSYSADDVLEAKQQYKKMMVNVCRLLSLFTNKTLKDGSVITTDKPLFDRYDRKLFLMNFGLIKNIYIIPGDDSTLNEINRGFSQEEMAMVITQMQIADGIIKPTYNEDGSLKIMSQAAISTRLKNIILKMNEAFEYYPELKTGFEYFLTKESELKIASQESEKSQVNLMAKKYAQRANAEQNDEILNISFGNGKTVNDILNDIDYHSDDEILDMFDKLIYQENYSV